MKNGQMDNSKSILLNSYKSHYLHKKPLFTVLLKDIDYNSIDYPQLNLNIALLNK